MEKWILTTAVSALVGKCGADESPFHVTLADGKLTVSLFYDFDERPLMLCAECRENDTVTVIDRGFRLELYINGKLLDEEWQCGNRLYGDKLLLNLGAIELSPENDINLSDKICGQVNAQNFKPEENVFVGDCMPFTDGDTFHVFYLKDRHHHKSKWGFGAHQWAHIKSDDLIHWAHSPMAIGIDNPAEGSICTGSVAKVENKYLAYYAVRMSDKTPARITFSQSDDCEHFTKSNNYFALPRPYESVSARDPKVFTDAIGKLHMLVTTSYVEGEKKSGCLAHAILNGGKWEMLSPMIKLDIVDQPECSDYFCFNGIYYLVFSNFGIGHYLCSTKPFGPWTKPDNNIIKDELFRVPKVAIWHGRLIFVGWIAQGGFGGIMNFCEAKQKENGELEFIEVKEMYN